MKRQSMGGSRAVDVEVQEDDDFGDDFDDFEEGQTADDDEFGAFDEFTADNVPQERPSPAPTEAIVAPIVRDNDTKIRELD